MSITLVNTELLILNGVYHQIGADALIFPTNTYLWMGNPISNDIKKRAGTEIEQQAIDQGPVAEGISIITESGNLPYKKLIHCACISQEMHIAVNACSAYVKNSLLLAASHNVQSIHIIPFFLDILHVHLFTVAEQMLQGIIDFCINHKTSVKRITVISEDKTIIEVFNNTISTIFQMKKKKKG